LVWISFSVIPSGKNSIAASNKTGQFVLIQALPLLRLAANRYLPL
jgi:hypothetical protein